jgi:hypothetical protein
MRALMLSRISAIRCRWAGSGQCMLHLKHA